MQISLALLANVLYNGMGVINVQEIHTAVEKTCGSHNQAHLVLGGLFIQSSTVPWHGLLFYLLVGHMA